VPDVVKKRTADVVNMPPTFIFLLILALGGIMFLDLDGPCALQAVVCVGSLVSATLVYLAQRGRLLSTIMLAVAVLLFDGIVLLTTLNHPTEVTTKVHSGALASAAALLFFMVWRVGRIAEIDCAHVGRRVVASRHSMTMLQVDRALELNDDVFPDVDFRDLLHQHKAANDGRFDRRQWAADVDSYMDKMETCRHV